MSRRSVRPVVTALGLLALLAVMTPAAAEVPYPSGATDGQVYDYASRLFIEDGNCSAPASTPLLSTAPDNDLPDTFDCVTDWKFSDDRADDTYSDRQDTPGITNNPQELFGVKGAGVNRAWEITTGRPDVVIAVLDSGIRWEEERPDLLRKHFINRGELPMPEGGPNPDDTRFGGYDVDGDVDADGVPDGAPDGVFNVVDYWADSRVVEHLDDANDVVDPADLIRTFSDGVDDDGNGYVDDISGWDFFENDNNPQDDVDYGHGTGEMQGSSGEAGLSSEGMCPNCMAMSLRVGDSFIADVNHFAEAVVYGVDNGAGVIQEALGTLNHTSYGQEAVDYAYRNGVIMDASEADEAAGHHNWPAAYDHTMVVNSVRLASVGAFEPQSYNYFNGCTNFGGYTYVSIPSTSCSSDATGLSSGYSGLLQSAAKNAVELGQMTNYLRDDGSQASFALSAEEAMQLWRLAADDLDFSSPCVAGASDAGDQPVHEFCDESPPYADPPTVPAATAENYATGEPATTRYQTVKGWDYFTGYGRSNAARLVRFIGSPGPDGEYGTDDDREYLPDGDGFAPYGVGPSDLSAQDRIPPEADITSPRWWAQYPHDDGTLLVPDDPANPGQIVVEGRAAANRVTDAGGTFDYVLEWAPHVQGLKTSQYAAAGGYQPAAGSQEDSHGPWTVVNEASGLQAAVEGELGRIDVADLAAALADSPNPFDPATDPTSRFQPEQYAIRLRLRVIAHPTNESDEVNNEAVFQKQVDVYPAAESVLRRDLGLDGDPTGGAGSPGFHDVNGDGVDELLIQSSDGLVHAYRNVRTGEELPGWPVTTDPLDGPTDATVGDGSTPVDNAYTQGTVSGSVHGAMLAGTPTVADLDDDGEVEVLGADMEGRLYAWNVDGTRRFRVTVDYSFTKEAPCNSGAAPDCDDSEPGDPKRNEWNSRDWAITYAPSVGDLDPTTPGLEIVAGGNDGHVYAFHADGSLVEGWPVVLRDPAVVEHMFPGTNFWCYDHDDPKPECADVSDGEGPVDPAFGAKVLVTPSLADLDGDGDLEVVVGVNEEYGETPNMNQAQDPALQAFGQVSSAGNTRVYALHHTGAATPETDATRDTAHLHDQAYVGGWPVPLAHLALELLPYVGAGTNSQAVIADLDGADDPDGDGKLEVAIGSVAGPGYLLNHDGSSYLGGARGSYNFLATSVDRKGALSEAGDFSSVVGVGALAIGSMDGGSSLTVAGPGAGLRRLLDVVLEADQLGAEDHLALWATNGDYRDNAPVVVNDLQFFTPPIVADITGDGNAEAIQGTAMSDTVAIGAGQSGLEATRYYTGGWHVNAAAVGDAPLGTGDDGQLQLASVTREGYLRLWPTEVEAGTDAACTALAEWPEFGHDAFNSGSYETDGERPYPLTQLESTMTGTTVTLRFAATGDDRACGSADHYAVRLLPGHVANPDWEDATPHAANADEPAPAGEPDEISLTVEDRGRRTVLVRAYDEAGNGSAVRYTFIGQAPDPDDPGDGGGDVGRSEYGAPGTYEGGDGSGPPTSEGDPDAAAAAACPPDRVPASGFGDIDGNTHEFVIDCLAWYAITLGRGDTDGDDSSEYDPGASVSRAQMASFVARLARDAGVTPDGEPADAFTDDDGNVHEPAVDALAALGIVEGREDTGDADGDGDTTETLFFPDESVSRAQMASFIGRTYRVASGALPAPAADRFDDDDDSVHEEMINVLVRLSIVAGRQDSGDADGDGDTDERLYFPAEDVRRDQMAAFLTRTLARLVDIGVAHGGGASVHVEDTSLAAGETLRGSVRSNRALLDLTLRGCGIDDEDVDLGPQGEFEAAMPDDQPSGTCVLAAVVTTRPEGLTGQPSAQTVEYNIVMSVE